MSAKKHVGWLMRYDTSGDWHRQEQRPNNVQ